MPAYEVTAVGNQVRDWAYKSGTKMKAYRVTLRNERGREMANVEWSKEAASAPPKPGDKTPDGSSVDTAAQYGPKLVVPKRGGGWGGGGKREDSPETRRSIAMQSSAARAVEIARLAHDTGRPVEAVTQDVLLAAGVIFTLVQKAEAG